MFLGLDISTSITGATILSPDGSMVLNESWDTRNKNKFPTLYEKANFVKSKILSLQKKYQIDHIFVEQSLQSFRSGFSSAKTLSTLSRFNGIVCWLCYDLLKIEPVPLAAASARKAAGLKIKRGENAKQKVLSFVVDTQPNFIVEYTKQGNPKPGVFDRADSYIIAKAGFLNARKIKLTQKRSG